MTKRAVVGSMLEVLTFGSTGPTWADSVNPEINISLTITNDTAPDPLAVGSTMNGTAQFSTAAQGTTNYSALGARSMAGQRSD
jgi:hypothetical protein